MKHKEIKLARRFIDDEYPEELGDSYIKQIQRDAAFDGYINGFKARVKNKKPLINRIKEYKTLLLEIFFWVSLYLSIYSIIKSYKFMVILLQSLVIFVCAIITIINRNKTL